jgi:two-component system cell cycle response regulator
MAHILVIEDNPANMELMVYLLKAFGHTPVEATTGEIGLTLAHDRTPDLILCDLQLPLPGMDGFEIARQAKADAGLAAIPLIAVTAYAMVGDRERVMAARFDGYIAKPITPETFVGQMEEFLPPDKRSNPPQSANQEH